MPDGEGVQKLSVRTAARTVTTVIVSAAVVEHDGRFLVTRRPAGVHLAGYWEFPGGKCQPQETLEACLRRELQEELAVDATVVRLLLTTTHEYDDRRVELHFFACRISGTLRALQGQEIRWVTRDELRDLSFPPADTELIDVLTRETGDPTTEQRS
jgi:8-oxo-dGTP diphosphatase